LDGQIDRRERARPALCFDEWRAAAIDNIDRTSLYSAAAGRLRDSA
jgi:hypothetical protein